MVKGPSRPRGIPGKVIPIQQEKSKRIKVAERRIGRFNDMTAAWDKIVDLYHLGKIKFIVFVPRDIYNRMPFMEGKQYHFAPSDCIGPRIANEIDHTGWGPRRVTKGMMPRMLEIAWNSHQGPVELFIDQWKDAAVGKVVPVTDS